MFCSCSPNYSICRVYDVWFKKRVGWAARDPGLLDVFTDSVVLEKRSLVVVVPLNEVHDCVGPSFHLGPDVADFRQLGASSALAKGSQVACECRQIPSQLVAVGLEGLLNRLLVKLQELLLAVLERVGSRVFGHVVCPNGTILGLHVRELEEAVLLRLRSVVPGSGTKQHNNKERVPIKKQLWCTSRVALPELSGRHFGGVPS